MIHLRISELIGSHEMVSADPLTWLILKIIHFGTLHHILTTNKDEQISIVVQR
jgi:hypothetical protein